MRGPTIGYNRRASDKQGPTIGYDRRASDKQGHTIGYDRRASDTIVGPNPLRSDTIGIRLSSTSICTDVFDERHQSYLIVVFKNACAGKISGSTHKVLSCASSAAATLCAECRLPPGHVSRASVSPQMPLLRTPTPTILEHPKL